MQDRGQIPFDIGEEGRSVHRSVDHEGGNDPIMTQTRHQSDGLPVPVWNGPDQSFAAGAAPLSRTMLVLLAVSSMNTSRAGFSMSCAFLQCRRARATSLRCCSAACRAFFKREIMSL